MMEPRFMKFAVDHAGEGIFWMNPEGRLLYANGAASRLLGYTPEEVANLQIFQVGPDMTPELWRELWKEIRQRGFFTFEFDLQAKGGRLFSAEITARLSAGPDEELACVY